VVSSRPPPYEPPPREEPPPPPPVHEDRPSWDSRGWALLGEQWVEGSRDRDIIRVGRREGAYTRLMLVVEGSDLRMNDLIITYDNGRKHSPRLKHEFREGSRTRPIDLKGEDARFIKEIELRYGNLPGGGRAKVQVWGKEGEVAYPEPRPAPRPQPPPPPSGGWDSRGWTLLGEQSVDGRKDKDFIRVGRREGRFNRLMLVVEGSDLRMDHLIITYDNGRKHSPRIGHEFREGSRTRPIDLKGEARIIKEIELRYANVPGGGRATVQVWGR
jgi:hypothetical protein